VKNARLGYCAVEFDLAKNLFTEQIDHNLESLMFSKTKFNVSTARRFFNCIV